MKKLILPLFILSSASIFAQPTITQGQFGLAVGDVITSYNQTYAVPTEGTNQTWDYTGFSTSGGTVINIASPGSSGIAGLPASTLCYQYGSTYDCYLIDGAGMQRTGAGNAANGVPYENGEMVFNFPITYGSNTNDNFHASFTSSGYPASRRGTVNLSVVGYGTLNLPSSVTINNAMLVKSHEVYTDSIHIVSVWYVVSYDFTSYNFYAAGYHGSIVTMSSATSTPGGTTTGGHYNVPAIGTGIETFDISGNLSIYPNPAEDQFSLTNNGNIEVAGMNYSIINMQGQVLRTGIVNGDNLNFDVSDLESGLYILSIHSDQFNASKRFIKQ